MKTPWTDSLDALHPLPEYPRPQMVRDNWLNLNGPWDYAITDSGVRPAAWDGTITVPYSPETALSGVGRRLKRGEYLWYRRDIELPKPFRGKRVLLHFGAVDQDCTLWVNGAFACTHNGGYLPFTAEITEAAHTGKLSLLLRVTDETDAGEKTRGKQKTRRGGIWYTPQSGIWQTVWMEAVPASYIRALRITPDLDAGEVAVSAEIEGEGSAVAVFGKKEYPLPARIPVPNCEAWSPEHPKLYDFSVRCGTDRVKSYFAMRKISVEKDGQGVPRLFLNNAPLFHNGLLDQGYWPDGLYTPASDEAFVFDIETAKAMGFNMLRKHIKVEPLRWYYHCDRLGMLVWQDMPSGGGRYNPLVITAPLLTGKHLSDRNYRLFARRDPRSREAYREELRGMVTHLYNCPCVVMWVPFNEGWGQFDAAQIHDELRALDPTRLIDHASGWHDQGVGALVSLHVYFKKYRFVPDAKGRAVLLSEFGGYNHRVKGHCFNKRDFGYRRFKSPEALRAALDALYRGEIRPAKRKGLAAAVYTQISDVEDELNGLMTYDRQVVKLDTITVKQTMRVE